MECNGLQQCRAEAYMAGRTGIAVASINCVLESWLPASLNDFHTLQTDGLILLKCVSNASGVVIRASTCQFAPVRASSFRSLND